MSNLGCIDKDHERFCGVFFAKNGCLACELESTSKLLKERDAEIERLKKDVAHFEFHAVEFQKDKDKQAKEIDRLQQQLDLAEAMNQGEGSD